MLEALLALLFGLLIGSFLNVCIYRWPRDLSVVRPRSHCTSCDKMIAAYDNVPVFSFLLLRGRCRYCKARISVRYPIVELVTGALFFYFVYALGPTVAALKMCVLSALLIGLTFSDLEERILPDEMTKGGMALGFLFALFVPVPDTIGESILVLLGLEVSGTAASVAEAAFGAVLPAFFLLGGRRDLFQDPPQGRPGLRRCEVDRYGRQFPGLNRRVVDADYRWRGRFDFGLDLCQSGA